MTVHLARQKQWIGNTPEIEHFTGEARNQLHPQIRWQNSLQLTRRQKADITLRRAMKTALLLNEVMKIVMKKLISRR